ncbi:MAG: hypothetical protein ACYTHK_14285 [Planctomycetota bacterium]|jgi:hypothetical protein
MRRAGLLLLIATLYAEEPATFPKSWEGTWKGPCVVVRDNKIAHRFPMELHVQPLDGRWTWTIVYGEQKRPYELLPVEGKPNEFVIDEKNSILIDAYFENDRLHSRFAVMDSAIDVVYARRGDEMDVTLTTFSVKPVRISGGEGKVPKVTSHQLRAVQRGTLKR